jgi:hypothetical protein
VLYVFVCVSVVVRECYLPQQIVLSCFELEGEVPLEGEIRSPLAARQYCAHGAFYQPVSGFSQLVYVIKGQIGEDVQLDVIWRNNIVASVGCRLLETMTVNCIVLF